MPIVVNTNSSAVSASFNLSRANDALRSSLERLSSGKRINGSGDDAGGMAVAYKLESQASRTTAMIQNTQNGLSFLQVQDGAMETIGKVVNRMAELRVMADDVTKNSGDIENYSKEFLELQAQLNQISRETFNGISLFATETAGVQTGEITGVSDSDLRVDGTFAYTANNGTAVQYDKFGRTFYSHPSGQASDGSISLNVVNLQFVLSIGTLDVNNTLDIDLGGLQNFDPNQAAGAGAFTALNTPGNNANTIAATPAAVSGRDMHATNLGTTIKGQAIPVADSSTAAGAAAGIAARSCADVNSGGAAAAARCRFQPLCLKILYLATSGG